MVPGQALRTAMRRPVPAIQRWRVRIVTPRSSSRRSQARSSGEAFIATGNTRPLVPTKVGWPRPWHQSISAAGGKASISGAKAAGAAP